MPAVSKSQQRYMAGCEHNPKHMHGCPDMTKGQMHDFAATKDKGLPQKVKPKRNKMLHEFLNKK